MHTDLADPGVQSKNDIENRELVLDGYLYTCSVKIDCETSPDTDTLTMCSVCRPADPVEKVILRENTRHQRSNRKGLFEVSVCSIGYRKGYENAQ